MAKKNDSLSPTSTGQVLDISRRHVTLLSSEGVITGTVASRALEVVAGDLVSYEVRDGDVFVVEVKPSERALCRSYRGALKRMGANIDLLFVITAVGPTLNPATIDRMIVAAKAHEIPVVLVINKSDLSSEDSAAIIKEYEKIGITVVQCSAKFGHDFGQIENLIQKPDVKVVALCGVSGVGKSTILNRLVPGAGAKTGEVSARTGQGKQTTSQPRGFLYNSDNQCRRIIIDFPGVQYFGLSHLKKEAIAATFDEFVRFKHECRFIDCKHLQEPGCGVRLALERGDIAPWRYQSYLQILEEIKDAQEY